MGWTEQIPNLIVIVSQSGGYTGLFMYDPAPGTGNLLASIAAPSVGTDPYGNDVTGGGFTAYDAVGGNEGRLIFLGPTSISMRTGNAGESTHAHLVTTVVATVMQCNFFSASTTGAADTAELSMRSNNTAGTSTAQARAIYNSATAVATSMAQWDDTGFNILIGSVSAANPTATPTPTAPATAETWHSLGSPSATGFTSNIAQYTYTAEGETEIDVKLTANAGGGTAGTYSYANTLPAAYRPPTTRIYPLGFNQTLASGVSNALIVNSSGVVQVKLAALSAATIVGTTVRVPLNV